jgi:exodeoxyribonuclease V alpha subunit
METPKEKLARLLAAARELKASMDAAPTVAVHNPIAVTSNETELNSLALNSAHAQSTGRDGNAITLNEKQLLAVTTAGSGASCIVIGAAGTGKTTCMREVVTELIDNGKAGVLSGNGHKHLPANGAPGIVAVSFTRRAVANLRRAMPDDMKANTLTIHALLEYQPVYYDVIDPETGDSKSTMRFEATRHRLNPLPSSIRVCIIEESSMVSLQLYQELTEALPSNVQFIFLGDIQQLPPVFGPAILGYKMNELPTIELTEVYRQALESPIIRLAHRILSGVPIPASEFPEWKIPGKLTIHPWKKKLDADNAMLMLSKFLTTAADNGMYLPEEDMILIPFNKACGTIELNKHIANHQAIKRDALVYEIVAGFNRHYLSVGDKVLYDKEDAIITEININGAYNGPGFQAASKTLDYWGFEGAGAAPKEHHISNDPDDLELLLSQTVAIGTGENDDERVRQASHIVTVRMMDSEEEIKVDTASDINALLLSYALTVHKSQGSEFRKVFFLLHGSHATMLQRELLYTAVTRAKEELYIICEPESLTKGILSQRIKGNSLAEKAIYFQGKLER